MAVMLTTSVGDLVIDLFTDLCPLATKNFLKLCKIKYYNNCLFHDVQKDFIVQTGDPTGTGSGGDSIYKSLYGDQARFFDDEIHPQLKHDKVGIVAMASAGENANASQFYITTRSELDYLDGKHTVFGEVGEGLETLMRINEAFVDEKNKPYKNIRIKHTIILDDPFDDPAGLADLIPDKSPELRPPAEGEEVRLEDDWVAMDNNIEPEELEKSLRRKEAQSRAVVLEMIGDLPEAEMAPPENVLFVCKLNSVTEEGDLELIFGRFGKVKSADIIRDYKTGDSLCYAFIEFETQEACEAAYFKMDNVLIDDRRIHVDFSQSVSHLWNRYRKLGTKGGDGQFANYGPGQQGKGRGCFKCGEVGHFAKECPNDGAQENEVPPELPKYSIKDTSGQRGNTSKRYEMVFDEDEGAAEPNSADKAEEGKRGSAREHTRKNEHKRRGGSGDRGRGHGYYLDQESERPQQGRRQERDTNRVEERDAHTSHNTRVGRDYERPRQERGRERSRDGGGHFEEQRLQDQRDRAQDDQSRVAERGKTRNGRHHREDSRDDLINTRLEKSNQEDHDSGRHRDGRRNRQEELKFDDVRKDWTTRNSRKLEQEQEGDGRAKKSKREDIDTRVDFKDRQQELKPHTERVDRQVRESEREHRRGGNMVEALGERSRKGRDDSSRMNTRDQTREVKKMGSDDEKDVKIQDEARKKFLRDDSEEVRRGRRRELSDDGRYYKSRNDSSRNYLKDDIREASKGREKGEPDDENNYKRLGDPRLIEKRSQKEGFRRKERNNDTDENRGDRKHGRDREGDDTYGRKRRHH